MILCIGEILTDMIEGADNCFQMFVGGAPFNVAVNAKQSGAEAAFVGRVGKDAAGIFIQNKAKLYSLDFLDLQTDDVRNTTLAFVALDENGERYFTFFRHQTADFFIDLQQIDFSCYPNVNIVHVGSLMLSEKEGRQIAKRLVDRIKQNNLVFSFDVNFRYDLYKDKAEAFKAYRPFIEQADILKMSADEIMDYTQTDNLEEAVSALKFAGLLLITLGAEGSMFVLDGISAKVETVKVTPVDTTGAGDAFYGAALALIDSIGYENLNEKNLKEILKQANVKGAKATLHKGAVSLGG